MAIGPDPNAVIESDDADSPPPIYRVRGGAVLSDGTIVVLNSGTQHLLFYTASGEFVRAVGGAGRGPSEFVDPTWLGVGSGDTLFVWDRRLSRLTILSDTGRLLRTRTVSFEEATGGPLAVRGMFADGSFLASSGDANVDLLA